MKNLTGTLILLSSIFLTACGGTNDTPAVIVDSDGVSASADAFPNDPNEINDSDNDGVGDNTDTFPNDATKQMEKAYLSENGVTIIAAPNNVNVGDTEIINGYVYTIVDVVSLKEMINKSENVSFSVTTYITDMSALFRASNFNQDISSWDVSNVVHHGSFSTNLEPKNSPF